MGDSLVVDIDAAIGRPSGNGAAPGRAMDRDLLLQGMDACGVDQAVVYHVVAKEHAPWPGNELLIHDLAGHPRLLPAFVLIPPFTGEQPPLPELLDMMNAYDVGLVRLFPASSLDGHRFAMREWCIGPVLTAMEEAAVPVAVDFSLFRRGEPPWDDVFEVCSKHPDLQLVLTDVQGRNNRSLYALLDRFPNLFLCTWGLNVHCGVEDITAKFGADRLLFGSNSPSRSMAAGRFVVDHADIAAEQTNQILGGNALRLLRIGQESRS